MKTKMIALMAAGLLTMATVAPAFAGAETVYVCHNASNGSYHVINVSMSSWMNSHSTHKADFLIDGHTHDNHIVDEATCLAMSN